MAKVLVDNRMYNMDPAQNLLHGCLGLGVNLPYFCWHPALGSVGACRQCAVKQFKDEQDTQGKIVMACMTPASEGTRISIFDNEAVEFRRAVIEGLMLNHPHDCPVCDEGGECHLQDMTVMTGHDYRHYSFEKRTFRNQYLGPFVNHEMNRCIQCYRCVRFYREYAGASDLQAFGLRDFVFFGRERDGVLESEFSGNLAEVCPTGVFTDATAKRHYARKWDLQFAPSVCVHCAVGCNTSPAERYGTLRRIVNRYHGDLNEYFLCDRGRFGYEFVNSPRRIRQPRLNGKAVSPEVARARLQELVGGGAVGIGSPRASLESNFALRSLVGAHRFYAGVGQREAELLELVLEILRGGPARTPTLREMEACDAILILGEDVTNTAPRTALSLRQALRQPEMQTAARLKIPLWLDHAVREAAQSERAPLFVATTTSTRLDGIATRTFRAAPDDLARLGFAVAHLLDNRAPAVAEGCDDAFAIGHALKAARHPLVISGTGSGSANVIRAAANVAGALPGCALAMIVPECNSLGLALMGAPPFHEAGGLAKKMMIAAEEAVNRLLKQTVIEIPDTLVILENNLYRRASAPLVDEFLRKFRHVVVLDHLESPLTEKAELVLPAATFAESDGTFLNYETRAQRFFQAFLPPEPVLPSWRWLGCWRNLDEVLCALAAELPQLSRAIQAAPPAGFRLASEKIPREPHRHSGRTAILTNISVNEPKPPDDPDSPLAFSMEGYPGEPPASLIPFFWSPGWNSYQAVNRFQEEIAGPLRGGNPGVRLIEPGGGSKFFTHVPLAFQPWEGRWLLVPRHHIFGSEELSREAPGIAELSPKPYVALHPEDAARFGAEVEVAGVRVPVVYDPNLPHGVAAVPAGLPPFEGFDLPQWTRIAPAS